MEFRMDLSLKIEKAIKISSVLHRNQERKRDGTPYISHLFSVTFLLLNYTNDEDIIIAGILHDTIEDTDYTPSRLRKDFGKRVEEIVMGVTEDKKIRDWAKRKEKYLAQLKKDRKGSLLVAAADKIHNLISLKDAYEIYGNKLWEHFSAPSPDKYFWFHGEVLKILRRKLDNPIINQLEKQYEETKKFVVK